MKKANKKEQRKVSLMLILGTNGTGKTTTCANLIKQAGRKTLIVDYEGRERMWANLPTIHSEAELADYGRHDYGRVPDKEGQLPPMIQRILYAEHEIETLRWIYRRFRNGIIVFDDCRMYLDSREDKDLKRLLIRRRQNMSDMIFVGHGFTEIPVRVYTFTDDIVLFKTTDSVKRLAHNFRDPELVLRAQQKVNAYVAKTGKKHYSEHVNFD